MIDAFSLLISKSPNERNILVNLLKPYIIKALTSQKILEHKRRRFESKRRKANAPHRITVFLAIDDPHSYLIVQVLKEFQNRYDLEFDCRTVLNRQPEMFPAPGMWDANALGDVRYLATLYQLDFPAVFAGVPAEFTVQATAQLLHWELQPGYLDNALTLFKAYWHGDTKQLLGLTDPVIRQNAECYAHHLSANEKMLKDKGHYLSGNLHYGGEWYWSIDRLHYLENRLNDLGACRVGHGSVVYNRSRKLFCRHLDPRRIQQAKERGADTDPIELFWSLRSPYSYLGLVRARKLAGRYGVPLVVKPVLPMVMRRMQVPKTKGLYIMRDAKREALEHGIDIGFVADPLGEGVERCYALFNYARQKGKELDYLETYARSVWSQGIRSETDKGLQKIVERAGLSWREARRLLSDDSWRTWAQHNLLELYSRKLWGVPSFTYRDTNVFGQDKMHRLEMAIAGHFEKE